MKNKQRTKLGAAVATTIGVVATFTLFIGGVDKAGVPDPITVDGQTIEFTWTDENDKEDLIIWTDQKRYSQGLSSAEVYVAVANMSGVEQDIELAGYFVNERRYIKDIKVLVEVEEIVPAEYETVCVESENKQVKLKGDTASSTAEDLKCSEKITKKETTQMVNKWVELPSQQNDLFEVSKDLVKLAKSDKVRKSVDGYIAEKKSSEFSIKDREVLYYKLNIVYPAGDDGNFFLEAIGSQGAYGHLDPWFDTDWTKRVAITIDATKVPSTQTSFPVYVDLGELPAGFHTNVKSDGCDIRVVESDETTETAFELVDYDAGTDSGELHFMADSISGSTDTTFYIYYGNAGASCYAVGATYGRNAVWSDYQAVYHMEETSGSRGDSTGNGHDLTDNNSVLSAAGVMGNAADFEASNSKYLDATDAVDISSQATISAWIKKESSTFGYVVQKGTSDSDLNYRIYIGASSGGGFYRKVGSTMRNLTHTFSWSNNTDYLIHCVQDGDGGEIYINASSIVTDNNGGNLSANNGILTVGARNRGSGAQNYLDGLIEELRMRTSAVTANWITTEHNNQSSVSTFITPGAEEDNGGGSDRRIININ